MQKKVKHRARSFMGEFRAFAVRGNVIDLAVGVVIGGAFGKIVNSVVGDIFMPLIAPLTGRVDFRNKFIAMDGKSYETIEVARAANVPLITYGNFLQVTVEFLIVAFAVFLFVRKINLLRERREPPALDEEPTTKECPFCMAAIPIKATRCQQCTSHL